MSELSIRPLRDADLQNLADVASRSYADAFGQSLSWQELASELRDNRSEGYFREVSKSDTILVADAEDRILGYVQFGDVTIPEAPAKPGDQEIHRVYIDTDLQSQGLGRKLMTAALAHERLASAADVYLQVWDQNPLAVALYEGLGFESIGRTDVVVDSSLIGQDLVMVRRQAGGRS